MERGSCPVEAFLNKATYKTMSILASNSRPKLGKLILWG